MAARLILNADDFGLTCGINRAIGELYQAGVLSSATLMASGPAFEDAVVVARAHPGLGVGCHIVLTDGVPVAPPKTIRSLLSGNGTTLRPSLAAFFLAVLLGRVDAAEIEREAVAQITKLQRAGIAVTHLDTHKHTHLLPAVARPLLQAAERCGVTAIRNPFEQPWSIALSGGPLLRRLKVHLTQVLRPRFFALPQIRSGVVRTTDGIVGVSATGDLNARSLRASIDALPAGTCELLCHPGYYDAALNAVATRLREHRNVERQALLSEIPRLLAHPNAPRLIHYGNL